MTQTTNTPGALLPHLWRGGQWGHYWTDAGKESLWVPPNKPAPIPAKWARQNVYFSVHPCREIPPTNSEGEKVGRKAIRVQNAYVAAVNCFFAEFDAKHFDGGKPAIPAHLDSFPHDKGWPYPSVIVDSGGGFHAYWLLAHTVTVTDENRDTLRAIQATWVTLVGGDKGAKDFARVLRVPGTLNVKPEYGPNFPTVTTIEANWRRLYDLADFEQLTEELRRTPEPTPAATTPTPALTVTTYTQRSEGGGVIEAFNDRYKIADVLRGYAYTGEGVRLSRPDKADSRGVQIKTDKNVAFPWSGNDPLHRTNGNGNPLPVDPFAAYCQYEHNGDVKAAVKAAAGLLGMDYKNGAGPIPDEPPPGIGNEDPAAMFGPIVSEEPPWMRDTGNATPTVHYEESLQPPPATHRHPDEPQAVIPALHRPEPVFRPLSLTDLLRLPPKQWLLEQVIGAGDLCMLYGPPGTGKTFVAIDMIFSLCLGLRWAMRFDVARPLSVAYCAGEGTGGLPQRFAAAAEYYGADELPNFTFYATTPQLHTKAASHETVSQFVNDWKARDGGPLDLLVIDTFHSATVGAEENSATDTGLILAALRMAQRALGCAVLLLHHTNKNGTAERGSSALRGAMDSMIGIAECGHKFQMACAKLKDGAAWQSQTFALVDKGESVRVWWDEPALPGAEKGKEQGHRDNIIALLAENGGQRLRATAIAEVLGLNRSQTNSLLAKMAIENLLQRQAEKRDKPQNNFNPWVYFIEPETDTEGETDG